MLHCIMHALAGTSESPSFNACGGLLTRLACSTGGLATLQFQGIAMRNRLRTP